MAEKLIKPRIFKGKPPSPARGGGHGVIMPGHLLKNLNRDMGRAIHRYGMIAHQDRILVGLSGGKDSLVLLWLLRRRLSRIPIAYTLFPVYIDPGFPGGFVHDLEAWVQSLGLSLRVETTTDGPLAHSPENRENPCFLCARLRRRRLFALAENLECGKIALGHHKDDIIETFFINMCFSGVMGAMRPIQPFFGGRFQIIRPLAFVDEGRIERFAGVQGFPQFHNPCPYGKISRRKTIKDFLEGLYRINPNIKANIFNSLGNVNQAYLLS